MTNGDLVDALLIARIHLLGGTEKLGHILLAEIVILPQFANSLPNRFQSNPPSFTVCPTKIALCVRHLKNSTINDKTPLDNTPYLVYNVRASNPT